MTQRKPEPTPIQTFLAPLAALARKQPDIEALVFWEGEAGWADQPSEALEAEEIVFYAEGLLEDGFHLIWTVVALAASPAQPDHIRLHFWQEAGHPPPALQPGWTVLNAGRWTSA